MCNMEYFEVLHAEVLLKSTLLGKMVFFTTSGEKSLQKFILPPKVRITTVLQKSKGN